MVLEGFGSSGADISDFRGLGNEWVRGGKGV